MTYSYTQISQYLACPRRYKHRYLDGWKEKDTRATMLFGRAFEKALAAFFRREDSAAALFQEWSAYKQADLTYSAGVTWDRMLQQGIQLLDRFAQEDRIRIRQPQSEFADQVYEGRVGYQRFRRLRRRHWHARWHQVSFGMENHFGSLSGTA